MWFLSLAYTVLTQNNNVPATFHLHESIAHCRPICGVGQPYDDTMMTTMMTIDGHKSRREHRPTEGSLHRAEQTWWHSPRPVILCPVFASPGYSNSVQPILTRDKIRYRTYRHPRLSSIIPPVGYRHHRPTIVASGSTVSNLSIPFTIIYHRNSLIFTSPTLGPSNRVIYIDYWRNIIILMIGRRSSEWSTDINLLKLF